MRQASDEVCSRMRRELISFQFLDEEDIPLISPYFECRLAKTGEVLWREGDACDYLAFIINGRVDVKKETEFEGKQVIVGVYGRGAMVGQLCFLDNTPRAVTAVALEDTNLLLLSHEKFEELLAEYPITGIRLLKGMLLTVSIRLRKSFDRLASIF